MWAFSVWSGLPKGRGEGKVVSNEKGGGLPSRQTSSNHIHSRRTLASPSCGKKPRAIKTQMVFGLNEIQCHHQKQGRHCFDDPPQSTKSFASKKMRGAHTIREHSPCRTLLTNKFPSSNSLRSITTFVLALPSVRTGYVLIIAYCWYAMFRAPSATACHQLINCC